MDRVGVLSTSRPRYCEATTRKEQEGGHSKQPWSTVTGNFCVFCPSLFAAAAIKPQSLMQTPVPGTLAARVLVILQRQIGVDHEHESDQR